MSFFAKNHEKIIIYTDTYFYMLIGCFR